MRKSLRALNAANFFMADVQAGLGPFLGVFLRNSLVLFGIVPFQVQHIGKSRIGRSEAVRCFTAVAIAMSMLTVAGGLLYAEDYPVRPIHLIVGFPPGSIADVAFRVVSANENASRTTLGKK